MQWLDGLRYHVVQCWMNTILGSTSRLDWVHISDSHTARLFLDPHTAISVIRYEQHLLLLNTEMFNYSLCLPQNVRKPDILAAI